ncbi:PucR family transcriptional regulator [Prauserella oleivorans]
MTCRRWRRCCTGWPAPRCGQRRGPACRRSGRAAPHPVGLLRHHTRRRPARARQGRRHRGLLAQLDHPGARGWADALLEPLERHASRSKLDLVSTLRVYLANNSHIDASSTALGIHRHTLRYRLRRISELLDTDLDDPTARAELWLALRMREMR